MGSTGFIERGGGDLAIVPHCPEAMTPKPLAIAGVSVIDDLGRFDFAVVSVGGDYFDRALHDSILSIRVQTIESQGDFEATLATPNHFFLFSLSYPNPFVKRKRVTRADEISREVYESIHLGKCSKQSGAARR